MEQLSKVNKVKYTRITRNLKQEISGFRSVDGTTPQVGDVVLTEIVSIGRHKLLESTTGHRLRLYPGDLLCGAFGNRYAADHYEGYVSKPSEPVHVLSNSGVFGTVTSKNRSMAKPTEIRLLGYALDSDGDKINTLNYRIDPVAVRTSIKPLLILSVGTGMNSGKTTAAATCIHDFVSQGFSVRAGKITGTANSHDPVEMISAGADEPIVDFSDVGYPSTFLCSKEELINIYETIYSNLAQSRPDVIVLEIADGLLQQETTMLLENDALRNRVDMLLLSAPDALAAIFGTKYLEDRGYNVDAVTGLITSSPLNSREFTAVSDVPLVSSGNGVVGGFYNTWNSLRKAA